MDPLSALRDFTIRGDLDKINRVNEEFRFGNEYSFPCTAETAYRSKQGNLYTLESLLYYVKNSHVKHTEYIQNARTLKIQPVTLPDRKPLLEYLQGKLTSTDAIELVVPRDLNPKQIYNDDVEEYRPEDPGLDKRDFVEEQDFKKIRVSDKFDYMGMIRVLEKPLKDREQLLECRQRDFYSILVASTKREEERQRIESQQRKDGLVAKSRLMGTDERGYWKDAEELGIDTTQSYFRGKEIGKSKLLTTKGNKIGEGVPIILVPSAFQTLITIYNVKEFLEDGVFIPTDVKVKQMNGQKMAKPDCVTVQKKISRDRVVAAYEVRDKPSTLKTEDWERVVAVFVLGKEWQFKDWPFKDHVEIFNKSKD